MHDKFVRKNDAAAKIGSDSRLQQRKGGGEGEGFREAEISGAGAAEGVEESA